MPAAPGAISIKHLPKEITGILQKSRAIKIKKSTARILLIFYW